MNNEPPLHSDKEIAEAHCLFDSPHSFLGYAYPNQSSRFAFSYERGDDFGFFSIDSDVELSEREFANDLTACLNDYLNPSTKMAIAVAICNDLAAWISKTEKIDFLEWLLSSIDETLGAESRNPSKTSESESDFEKFPHDKAIAITNYSFGRTTSFLGYAYVNQHERISVSFEKGLRNEESYDLCAFFKTDAKESKREFANDLLSCIGDLLSPSLEAALMLKMCEDVAQWSKSSNRLDALSRFKNELIKALSSRPSART